MLFYFPTEPKKPVEEIVPKHVVEKTEEKPVTGINNNNIKTYTQSYKYTQSLCLSHITKHTLRSSSEYNINIISYINTNSGQSILTRSDISFDMTIITRIMITEQL